MRRKINKKTNDLKSVLFAINCVFYMALIFLIYISQLQRPNSLVYYFTNCSNRENLTNCIVTHENGIFTNENGSLLPAQNFVFISLYKDKIFISRPYFIDSENVIKTYYGRNGIRKELQKINSEIKQESTKLNMSIKGTVVIIKPTKQSTLQNLVDILDEMAIAKIGTFTIANNFTPYDSSFYLQNN